jgi:hypothetical protein
MDEKWSGNSYLLDFNSFANHGGYLGCLFFITYLLTINKQVVCK